MPDETEEHATDGGWRYEPTAVIRPYLGVPVEDPATPFGDQTPPPTDPAPDAVAPDETPDPILVRLETMADRIKDSRLTQDDVKFIKANWEAIASLRHARTQTIATAVRERDLCAAAIDGRVLDLVVVAGPGAMYSATPLPGMTFGTSYRAYPAYRRSCAERYGSGWRVLVMGICIDAPTLGRKSLGTFPERDAAEAAALAWARHGEATAFDGSRVTPADLRPLDAADG